MSKMFLVFLVMVGIVDRVWSVSTVANVGFNVFGANLIVYGLSNSGDGGTIISGSAAGNFGGAYYGGTDGYVRKYSSSLGVVWTKQLGTSGNEDFTANSVGPSGSVYVTGFTTGSLSGFTNAGSQDTTAYILHANGTERCHYQLGGSGVDTLMSLLPDEPNGIVYGLGYTASSTIDGNSRVGTQDSFLYTLNRYTCAKTSMLMLTGGSGTTLNLLNALWARDGSGKMWIAGTFQGTSLYSQSSIGSTDICLIKMTTDGSSKQVTLFGTTSAEGSYYGAMAIDASDNVYLTGTTTASMYGNTYLGGANDMFVTKVDTSGSLQWTVAGGGDRMDSAVAITLYEDMDALYVTGLTASTVFYGVSKGSSGYPFLVGFRMSTGAFLSVNIYTSEANFANTNFIVWSGLNLWMAGNVVGGAKQSSYLMKLDPQLTHQPTLKPTLTPSAAPTALPSADPSAAPSASPSAAPTASPSSEPSLDPSAAPSAIPSFLPTAAPSFKPTPAPSAAPTLPEVCTPIKWYLGRKGESCATTCSNAGRTCRADKFQTVLDRESFIAMVSSAVSSNTGEALGENVCNGGVSTDLAGVPLIKTRYTSVVGETTMIQDRQCSYPSSRDNLEEDCDSVFNAPPAQRFCPCETTCGEVNTLWFLGHSGESCTQTCGHMAGTCEEDQLRTITTAEAFNTVVSTAMPLNPYLQVQLSAESFCNKGINTYCFANAPATITYLDELEYAEQETYCTYPTTTLDSCTVRYRDPPAQRYCPCTVHMAAGERRALKQIDTATVMQDLQQQQQQPVPVVAASKLRGRQEK